MTRRRRPDCDCGSPWWNHHEAFCPQVTGVPNCGECGEFHTGRCESYTRCCDPTLSVVGERCRGCPEVSHAA